MNIKFSKVGSRPYDKLLPDNFKEGNLFTTFRAYTAKKDTYYSSCMNKEFYVLFDNKTIGKATLVNKEYKWSSDLTLEDIKRDTFKEWQRSNFEDLMYNFYGNYKVFGFWLVFQINKVGQLNKTLESF